MIHEVESFQRSLRATELNDQVAQHFGDYFVLWQGGIGEVLEKISIGILDGQLTLEQYRGGSTMLRIPTRNYFRFYLNKEAIDPPLVRGYLRHDDSLLIEFVDFIRLNGLGRYMIYGTWAWFGGEQVYEEFEKPRGRFGYAFQEGLIQAISAFGQPLFVGK